MSFVDELKKFYHTVQTWRWPGDAKVALLRVLYDLYQTDGEYSFWERGQLEQLARVLDTSLEKIETIDLDQAMTTLRADESRLDVLCYWMAAAVFADDYVRREEIAFICRLAERHKLPPEQLTARIQRQRARLITAGIREGERTESSLSSGESGGLSRLPLGWYNSNF